MKKIVIMFLIIVISCNLAPGSYPYAEVFNIESTELNLIEKIKQFKKENPEFNVPPEIGLVDGRSSEKRDYWYHVYFYYKKDNQIAYAWLRPSENGITSFALVGINQGLELGHWREINHDFSSEEDYLQKEKFENLILNKIKAIRDKEK